MKISVIGTGYVGLVTGTCFADKGNDVTCIDVNESKINDLKKGIIPIYEPGLEDLVKNNVEAGRLHFTTKYSDSVPTSDVCFIAVGTPPLEDGSADVHYVVQAAVDIANNIDYNKYTVIVDKSTVPVGTADKVYQTIESTLSAIMGNDKNHTDTAFDVVSNPEFLKEGTAVSDFLRPDRVVLGVSNEKSKDIMLHLYKSFIPSDDKIIVTDVKSAEITKYAANAMLATRISFMNDIAKVCDKFSGDVMAVRKGIGTDSRIGMPFLYASCGYGGSCFPKDVKELIAVGERNGIDMKVAKAVEDVNNDQKHILTTMIKKRFGDDLKGKVFAIWGLAFKPNTDDARESAAIEVIKDLIKAGARIQAYDPKAYKMASQYLADYQDSIDYENSKYAACYGADALVLVTEWGEFLNPDFEEIKKNLNNKIFFDGRNKFDPSVMKSIGIEYHCIGRGVA